MAWTIIHEAVRFLQSTSWQATPCPSGFVYHQYTTSRPVFPVASIRNRHHPVDSRIQHRHHFSAIPYSLARPVLLRRRSSFNLRIHIRCSYASLGFPPHNDSELDTGNCAAADDDDERECLLRLLGYRMRRKVQQLAENDARPWRPLPSVAMTVATP